MNEISVIITPENPRITNINTFSTDNEHNTSFPDQILYKVTKRMYISFTLESAFNLSQIKYESRYNSQKEASVGFFLEIDSKLTLRKALKQKIDKICLSLDLYDEDTIFLKSKKQL